MPVVGLAMVLLAFLATSCEKRQQALTANPAAIICCEYLPTDIDAWHASDTLRFDLPPQPAACTATLTLLTRTTTHYPFRNLQLRTEVQEVKPLRRKKTIRKTINSLGNIVRTDTSVSTVADIEIVRADRTDFTLFTTDDMPTGKLHPYLQNEQTLGTINMQAGRHYRVCVTHTMRLNPLPGIADIGIIAVSDCVQHPF